MKKFILFTFNLFLINSLFSQPLNPIVDSIPMRDGKKLAADIYIPSVSIQRPTILIQTPYNKFWYRYNLPLGIGTDIDSSGYNFVVVDWRGFYGSVSAWIPIANRGEDGSDIIDWLIAQSWSDGQVGTWGASALGKVQFQTAREKHPNHICAVPLVAGPQFNYLEYYPGGVYRTEYVEQLDALGYGLSSFLLSNPYYNATWQWVENENYYPSDIEIPMFMIGGWYDHNTDLMLDFFNAIIQLSPSPVNAKHKLLMGPWAHGGFGSTQVGTAQQGELFYYEAESWSDSLAMMFFDYYLLDINNGWDSNPVIKYFQMGENTWQNTSVWPTTSTTNFNLYLSDGGILDIYSPTSPNDSSIIIYDPRDPSPTIGGATLNINLLQGPYDQSDTVEIRNDILLFTTPELIQDVCLKGKPIVHLFVSSDRLDTDFVIRLTDLYPDGSSMLLAETIKRMRFRNGYTENDTASMVPGQIYEIEIELKNMANTFLTGHKIRIAITSSNYPRFDNNLNNGQEMYVAGDTLIATNIVYHNSNYSSYVEFPFVDYAQSDKMSNTKNPVFSIYPNPCNDILYLHTALSGIYKITMYDIYGKTYYMKNVLNKSKLNNKTLIDLSDFNKGIYFIKINDNKNNVSVKKLMRY